LRGPHCPSSPAFPQPSTLIAHPSTLNSPNDPFAMENRAANLDVLLEIDSRHEDLLVRLDELDKRVEQVLKEWQAVRQGADCAGK